MDRQAKRIIIEGMDGAGKTVLVDHLLSCFPDLELVVNKEGPNRDFNTWWPEEFDRQTSQPIPLHDRFFYSELVYGPAIRGHITAESQLVNNGLWFLRSTALLVYARPHTDQLREGIKQKEQMEGVNDRFIQLLEAYDQLMEVEKGWYGPRFVHYVWHRDSEFQRVEGIIQGYLTGEIR